MLVLTRRKGDRIVIKQLGIEILVRKIQKNGKVVLGIQAPKELKLRKGKMLPEVTK